MPRTRSRKRSRAKTYQQRRDDEHLYKLSLLREFVAKHGWTELRASTRFHGVALFNWVHLRRNEYKTGEIRDFLIPLVEAIPGWSWDPVRDRHRRNVDNLRAFVREHGWRALTWETKVEGVLLAQWCATRRAEYKRKTLPAWLGKALEAIPGWKWTPIEENHMARIEALREHIDRNGWEGFRQNTIDRYGNLIGRWASHARELYRAGRLPQWIVDELDAIEGWVWEPLATRHERNVERLRRFVAEHGWRRLQAVTILDDVPLGRWVMNCRNRYHLGTISKQLARALEKVPGWSWQDQRIAV